MNCFQIFQYFTSVTNHKAQWFTVLDNSVDNETDSCVLNAVLITDFKKALRPGMGK